MIFSSESFLFFFLPTFLAIYYVTPVRWRSVTILVGSYLFYAWWRLDFLGLLFLTTLWAFIMGKQISKHGQTRTGRIYLTIAVAGCLGVLAVFKYLNFFVDSIAALVGTDAAGLGVHWQLILPIGISFYVFQAVSYIIDVYRGDARSHTNFIDFAAFIALFPQLIAGPILRFKDLEDQFRQRQHSATIFYQGMIIFLIGLAKKVVLADAIAPLADAAFSHPEPSAALSWLGAIAYTLQLYFDFSGYSSMAIGLGLMMGFHFNPNFNMPYLSFSITEFWQRWHISLSIWLRDYLYVPLGGNRRGALRTYLNLMIVMILGGLWHGAAWKFALWGFWHGILLALERATGYASASKRFAWKWPLTLVLVIIGWVMFRADDVAAAFVMYKSMLGLNGFGIPIEEWQMISTENLLFIGIGGLIVCLEPYIRGASLSPAAASGGSVGLALSSAKVIAVLLLAMFTIAKLAEQSVSPFLYFQF